MNCWKNIMTFGKKAVAALQMDLIVNLRTMKYI